MSDLLELAARCEAATRLGEASAILAAHDCMFPEPPSNYQPRATPSFSVEWSEWSKRMCAVRNFVQVGAHIDAAMTLLPADAFWRLGNDGEGPDPADYKAEVMWFSSDHPHSLLTHRKTSVASTPALAITAACLRARASVTPTGNPSSGTTAPHNNPGLGVAGEGDRP